VLRMGLVDLCTSHPGSFVPILRQMDGVEVAAVYDSGAARPDGYAEQFAAEHAIPHACERLEDMLDLVDAAIVHSADWDSHLDRARPFIEAGKPVYIDKPVVANLRDLNELLNLEAKHGTLIMGGSSLRWAAEVQELRDRVAERGEVVSAFGSGPGDFFNYGIHTIEMLGGLLGSGVRSVTWVASRGTTDVFHAAYSDGRMALFQLGSPHHEWQVTVTTTGGGATATVDAGKLYEALLRHYLAALETGQAPVPLRDVLESIQVALAAKVSRRTRQPAFLDELTEDERFDGHAFNAEYARGRR